MDFDNPSKIKTAALTVVHASEATVLYYSDWESTYYIALTLLSRNRSQYQCTSITGIT